MLAQNYLRSRCFVRDEYEEPTQKSAGRGGLWLFREGQLLSSEGGVSYGLRILEHIFSAGPGEVKTELGENGRDSWDNVRTRVRYSSLVSSSKRGWFGSRIHSLS